MEREGPPFIEFSKFDPKRLNIPDFANIEGARQRMSFISYGKKEKQCLISLPQIELTRYGIPRPSDYWETVESRQMIKVPLDPNQPNCKKVRKLLTSIDEVASSNEVKKRLFGESAKNYKYASLIKEPVDPSLYETKGKSIKEGPEYFKVKFDSYYPNTKTIKTQLYLKGEPNNKPKVVNETLDKYEEYITPRSEVQMIIQPFKLWAAKVPKERGLKIDYGIGLKVIQVIVKPGEVSGKEQIYRSGKSLVSAASETDSSSSNEDSDSDSE